ncbi:hypothetical protein SNEBB_009750 [Seison nebaliae]|nr:hypothetical protein SNEBB_009750 [Seison nebaliae]
MELRKCYDLHQKYLKDFTNEKDMVTMKEKLTEIGIALREEEYRKIFDDNYELALIVFDLVLEKELIELYCPVIRIVGNMIIDNNKNRELFLLHNDRGKSFLNIFRNNLFVGGAESTDQELNILFIFINNLLVDNQVCLEEFQKLIFAPLTSSTGVPTLDVWRRRCRTFKSVRQFEFLFKIINLVFVGEGGDKKYGCEPFALEFVNYLLTIFFEKQLDLKELLGREMKEIEFILNYFFSCFQMLNGFISQSMKVEDIDGLKLQQFLHQFMELTNIIENYIFQLYEENEGEEKEDNLLAVYEGMICEIFDQFVFMSTFDLFTGELFSFVQKHQEMMKEKIFQLKTKKIFSKHFHLLYYLQVNWLMFVTNSFYKQKSSVVINFSSILQFYVYSLLYDECIGEWKKKHFDVISLIITYCKNNFSCASSTHELTTTNMSSNGHEKKMTKRKEMELCENKNKMNVNENLEIVEIAQLFEKFIDQYQSIINQINEEEEAFVEILKTTTIKFCSYFTLNLNRLGNYLKENNSKLINRLINLYESIDQFNQISNFILLHEIEELIMNFIKSFYLIQLTSSNDSTFHFHQFIRVLLLRTCSLTTQISINLRNQLSFIYHLLDQSIPLKLTQQQFVQLWHLEENENIRKAKNISLPPTEEKNKKFKEFQKVFAEILRLMEVIRKQLSSSDDVDIKSYLMEL